MSVALIAAGVALAALVLPVKAEMRFAAAVLFVVLGLLSAVRSWVGWIRTERSMRDNRALPAPALSVALATGVVLAGVLIVIGLLL